MDAKQALAQAVQELTKASKRKGDVGDLARRVLPLLAGVEAEVQKLPAVTRVSQRAKALVTYVVEARGPLETLAERRLRGNAQPFRCPKTVYDGVVAVLAGAKRSLSVEEIAAAVEERLGERPADYQLRVPLRLWMHVEPPLITRSRARYRPATVSTFKVLTDALWKKSK